jgi:putative ABC transport system permease protein
MEIRPILSTLLRNRTGALLIAAQVALTLGILCNALYVVNDRLGRSNRASGVDEANVFTIAYNGFREDIDRKEMQRRDIEVLRALPGVLSATWTNQVPMSQSGWGLGLSTDPSDPATGIGAAAYFSPGSLVDAFGLQLVEGRDFNASDIVDVDPQVAQPGADVVMITRQLGGRLFPDDSSYVGKTIHLGTGGEAQPMRVIGVIEQMMSPFAQNSENAYSSFILPVRYLTLFSQYAVRTEPGERSRVMRDAEAALSALRNDRVLLNNRTMEEVRRGRYANERQLSGMLLAVTGGLLLVTASGIVGMASLWVTQRRRQIGTRRALGATRLDIVRYFVTENLMITSMGAVLGVLLAIGLNLFLVQQIALPRLPTEYLAWGVAGLLALGVLAVLGPATRAAAVPPAVATRGA